MMDKTRFIFLFEQSGTFKQVAIKLGYQAYDYDIEDNFGQTDFRIDLFDQIDKAFCHLDSIFDGFFRNDVVMAFFPCVRFSSNFQLWLLSNAQSEIKKDDCNKVLNAIGRHRELHDFYAMFCKLVVVCLNRGLRLVIENPSHASYLLSYFPIKPKLVYNDRRRFGDNFKKPTMFYFFGWEPYDNVVLEARAACQSLKIHQTHGFDRSRITSDFARYFILAHLLPQEVAYERIADEVDD